MDRPRPGMLLCSALPCSLPERSAERCAASRIVWSLTDHDVVRLPLVRPPIALPGSLAVYVDGVCRSTGRAGRGSRSSSASRPMKMLSALESSPLLRWSQPPPVVVMSTSLLAERPRRRRRVVGHEVAVDEVRSRQVIRSSPLSTSPPETVDRPVDRGALGCCSLKLVLVDLVDDVRVRRGRPAGHVSPQYEYDDVAGLEVVRVASRSR